MAKGKAQRTSLRLRPADPFELIRWLARSQTDPRKAVAELVQNSLDAGAGQVRVERRRLRGVACLVVRDDGEGVIPELEREEALRWVATHIGQSRKRNLSVQERRQLMIAGQYGVGLLGFWSIGRRLEMRSRVAGSPLYGLRLVEDSESAEVVELPLPLDAPQTFTEIVVLELHTAALRSLGARRLCDYLSAELRGQLLSRTVELELFDGMARGTAPKRFAVVPRRFLGERLALPAELEVPEFPPLRIELYQARGEADDHVQVACNGTLVADDICDLRTLELDRPPWRGQSLGGILDFPAFHIPPGTRRGVAMDAAAEAFADAIGRLELLVRAELRRLEQERAVVIDREMVRDLRRALRGIHRRLPQYDLPTVADGAEAAAAPSAGEPIADPPPPPVVDPLPLLPPGPLASLRLVPAEVRVPPGGERHVRAHALDADGRPVRETVTFQWSLGGEAASVVADGAVARVRGGPTAGTAELCVIASQEGHTAEARAQVVIAEQASGGAQLGVPDPELVSDAAGTWRSRFVEDRWQINDAHEDYVALRGDARARLRYLLALLCKEIVLRSFGGPGSAPLLERMVEVLAHAERNLRGT